MGAKKEIGFWDGFTRNGRTLTMLVALCAVAWVGSRWLIYAHPKTESKTQKNLTRINAVSRNVTRTTRTTTPDGTVTISEGRDLTREEASVRSALISSSLSVPVFPPGPVFGVTFEREWMTHEYQFGAAFRPFSFLDVRAQTNLQLNRFSTGVTVWVP